MKKLLMVLFAAGMVGVVSAQPGKSRGRNDDYSHNNDHNRSYAYSNNLQERDRQIQVINRDFDQQIGNIRINRFMKPAQKSRRISKLEKQRAQQIEQVIARNSNNRSDRRDDYAHNNRRF